MYLSFFPDFFANRWVRHGDHPVQYYGMKRTYHSLSRFFLSPAEIQASSPSCSQSRKGQLGLHILLLQVQPRNAQDNSPYAQGASYRRTTVGWQPVRGPACLFSRPPPPTHLTNRVGQSCCCPSFFKPGRAREEKRETTHPSHTHTPTQNRAMTGCKSASYRTKGFTGGSQLTVVRDVVEREGVRWRMVVCGTTYAMRCSSHLQRREWRQGPYVQAFVGCLMSELFVLPSFFSTSDSDVSSQ